MPCVALGLRRATTKGIRLLTLVNGMASQPRWNSDMAAFREEFAKAKHVVILTGAGVSAESGVPTFRGAGGYWRRWQAQDLATPEAFADNPSLVWEFYHYRREVMATKSPNKAHLAIAECEKRLAGQGRRVTVVTQNIDELHIRAGTQNIIEMHGTLFKTRCVKCGTIKEDRKSPIVSALKDRGAPDPSTQDARIPEKDLPRCSEPGCDSLVRPHVVWFGEGLDSKNLEVIDDECDECDLCLVIGTSSVVYPAAMYAPMIASRGVSVAEFNTEETPATGALKYHFHGPAGQTVTEALARHPSEPAV
ncbi:NAD-dependent protein deacylase sirtuin-5, mitochondrial-like [Asterias rubens]|uniref:NAD-dependent protein deacylase sirtuin-5, mitochondrial-like n=1 Tax=Asterias rubens TaxID=7604 RepID=UPI0014553739|nr:NAD-dependent protein deacylase sirtuin-5, mitochondrial-like [Asterias rubens]